MTKPSLFTIEHFEAYTGHLVLDNGRQWVLEDFQATIADSVLSSIRRSLADARYGGSEVWAILPEGNAKTTLMAGLALYLADFSPLPWIPVGASTRDQAEILAQQAYQMIRMSPGMQRRFRIYEGYRRIQPIRPDHPAPGRRGIMVLAADVATGDGVIPFPLAICDEGHRHRDMRLYRLWRGKLLKRGGSIAMISTAGSPGHEFEQLRDEIRTQATDQERHGAHLVSRAGDRVVMHEWKVNNTDDVRDMVKVKEANPLSTITVEELQRQFESPTTDLGLWMRLKCNIAARAAESAVSDAEWDGAEEDAIPVGAEIDIGVDVAWKHDTFAIVPLHRTDDFHLLGDPEILVPPRDGSTLHPDEVKAAFERLLTDYQVETAVMDLQRAEDIAAWLEDEHGVRVIDWPQGNVQASADYDAFMDLLRNGRLKHTGDPGLREHVLHAVSRTLPNDKRRFDRPSHSRRKQDERVIDALTAAAMVNSYAHHVDDGALAGDLSDYRIEALI